MTEHDYPISQPIMVCPACEERWCVVQQMEIVRDTLPSLAPCLVVWTGPTYYLLTECSCGAQWAEIYGEGA
jgi:hypothetical protein